MGHQLEQSKYLRKSVYRYNSLIFSGMVFLLLLAIINLFIFPAKTKLSNESDVKTFVGKNVSIPKGILEYYDTGIVCKLPKNIDGYQLLYHTKGEMRVFFVKINGETMPLFLDKAPDKRIIVKVSMVERASAEWNALNLSTIEERNTVELSNYVLIKQGNEISKASFIAAGALFLILIALIPIRILQVMRWQKEDLDGFNEYHDMLAGK